MLMKYLPAYPQNDIWIWKNSSVGIFKANSGTDALLLGDKGYGIDPCLMTPYKNPQTYSK